MELLENLIRANSSEEFGEAQAARVLSDFFKSQGIASELDLWDKNRANLVAHIKSNQKRKSLLFACHLDVVPAGDAVWNSSPFEPVQRDGKMFGRGAADMKGGIAAISIAAAEIVKSGVQLTGDIIIASTAGEEVDSCGMKKFIDKYNHLASNLQGVIVPEPTGFDIITAHRGILWLEVTTHGKTAHGSMPHLGINAIEQMVKLLNELDGWQIPCEPDKLLGKCGFSVNCIEGGKATNVVPDSCSVKIDIRTLPTQSHREIIGLFQDKFEKLKHSDSRFDAEVKIIRESTGLLTDDNSEFVKNFCTVTEIAQTKAVGFTTDGPYLAGFGPVVIFGPGESGVCHQPNESIALAALEKAVAYYKAIILNFLT